MNATATGPALILIAGPAGAGKTQVAHAIARALPAAVVLDKDTLTSPLVEALLVRLGQLATDRESAAYLEHVRPLEYRTLLDAAFEVMRTGRIALAVAPFARELADPAWIDSMREHARSHGGGFGVVWVHADAEATRARMIQRGESRDAHKLARWADYAARTGFAAPSVQPVHVFDNRAPVARLAPTRHGGNQDGSDDAFATQLRAALAFIHGCAVATSLAAK